jgi:hypothetical protein
MNVSEFLNYRSTCPLCSSQLVLTKLRSKSCRVALLKHEDGRLVGHFKMGLISLQHKSYIVGFSFGLHDDSFMVELYPENGGQKYRDSVPLYLMEQCNEFMNNIGPFTMQRGCTDCHGYVYETNQIIMDKDHTTLILGRESYLLHVSYKHIRLNTLFNDDSPLVSEIIVNPYLSVWTDRMLGSSTYTDYIPFVSNDETFKRVKLLLAFL